MAALLLWWLAPARVPATVALCSWLAAPAVLRPVVPWRYAVAAANLLPAERCRCHLPTAAPRVSVALRLFVRARLRLERAARLLSAAGCLPWGLAAP